MNRFENFNPETLPEPEKIINETKQENVEILKSVANTETQEDIEEKEKEEKERLYKEEKDRRIEIAKKEILQKKIDELFEEFSKLLPEDLKSLSNTGKTSGGEKFRSSSLGELNLKEATTLAKMILNNEWVMDQILASLPELSEAWDTKIEEEATEKVEEQLAAEKEEKNNPDKPIEEDTEENLDASVDDNSKPPDTEITDGNMEIGSENPTA